MSTIPLGGQSPGAPPWNHWDLGLECSEVAPCSSGEDGVLGDLHQGEGTEGMGIMPASDPVRKRTQAFLSLKEVCLVQLEVGCVPTIVWL